MAFFELYSPEGWLEVVPWTLNLVLGDSICAALGDATAGVMESRQNHRVRKIWFGEMRPYTAEPPRPRRWRVTDGMA